MQSKPSNEKLKSQSYVMNSFRQDVSELAQAGKLIANGVPHIAAHLMWETAHTCVPEDERHRRLLAAAICDVHGDVLDVRIDLKEESDEPLGIPSEELRHADGDPNLKAVQDALTAPMPSDEQDGDADADRKQDYRVCRLTTRHVRAARRLERELCWVNPVGQIHYLTAETDGKQKWADPWNTIPNPALAVVYKHGPGHQAALADLGRLYPRNGEEPYVRPPDMPLFYEFIYVEDLRDEGLRGAQSVAQRAVEHFLIMHRSPQWQRKPEEGEWQHKLEEGEG